MKINILSPDEMTALVIRHLSGEAARCESPSEVQLRRFLRRDDCTLPGGLLHLLSMVSQSAKMAVRGRGGEWTPRIEFTGCARKKCLHLFIVNAWVLSVPPCLEEKASHGRRIRLSLTGHKS